MSTLNILLLKICLELAIFEEIYFQDNERKKRKAAEAAQSSMSLVRNSANLTNQKIAPRSTQGYSRYDQELFVRVSIVFWQKNVHTNNELHQMLAFRTEQWSFCSTAVPHSCPLPLSIPSSPLRSNSSQMSVLMSNVSFFLLVHSFIQIERKKMKNVSNIL